MMLLAGLNYANSLALFLTFLLAGFVLVAMQQCHRNLLGATLVAVTRRRCSRSGAGDALPLRFGKRRDAARPRRAGGARDGPPACVDLPPQGRARLELPLAAARRGMLRIGRLRHDERASLRTVSAWTWVHSPSSCWCIRPAGSLARPMPSGRPAPGAHPHGSSGMR